MISAFIVLIIGVQMIPLNALIIPIYLVLSKAHRVDTLSGVIVTYLTFVLPFTIWTLRGFMLGVPRDLEEASQVDGTTRFGAFLRILVPLIGPGLVATSIFAFIQAWNEYIMAYVLLHDPSKQTLTVWLASFTGDRGTAWGPLMAGATLTALPGVLFFVAGQRKIAFGPTAGRVRGWCSSSWGCGAGSRAVSPRGGSADEQGRARARRGRLPLSAARRA